jgi:dihydroorotate dehydrogenase
VTIYPLFRALLFKLDPETAHHLTLNLIRTAGGVGPINWLLRHSFSAAEQPVKAFGLNFSNPVGLAAGYDKDGLGWRGLACLGFGHIEIGTVTPRPQPGNPQPRVFRLIADQALVNRMGFPGLGEDFVRQLLIKPHPKNLILGVNIGKNKETPLESADQDYLQLFRSFAGLADYLTINISSPNTVGLRRLQEKQALDRLLSQIVYEREQLSPEKNRPPILVKLAPDLSDSELDDALEAIMGNKMDGVIATNTTLSREGLKSQQASESGGLSGVPLFSRSLEMVGKIYKKTGDTLPVIGVGGIFNASGVQKMLDAGAVLVQLYTGLIYEGPGLVKRILKDLQKQYIHQV